jgi:hypothetical protein
LAPSSEKRPPAWSLVAVALLAKAVEGGHAQVDGFGAALQAAEIAVEAGEQGHGEVVGLGGVIAVVLAQAFGEALAHERIVMALGDGAAGLFDAHEQAATAEGIVADHVLALAELFVEEAQGIRGGGALPLPLLEAGDDFFHGMELLDGAFETLREVGYSGAELIRLLEHGIEHAALLQRLAEAAEGVGEGFQLGHAIFGEVAQHAQEGAQAGGDDGPALMQAEGLVFQPACGNEAIEKLAGALACIAQGRTFVLGQQGQGMPGDDFADDLVGFTLRKTACFTGFLYQAICAVHIHRRRGPGERAEKIRRHAAAESGAERFRKHSVCASWGGRMQGQLFR